MKQFKIFLIAYMFLLGIATPIAQLNYSETKYNLSNNGYVEIEDKQVGIQEAGLLSSIASGVSKGISSIGSTIKSKLTAAKNNIINFFSFKKTSSNKASSANYAYGSDELLSGDSSASSTSSMSKTNTASVESTSSDASSSILTIFAFLVAGCTVIIPKLVSLVQDLIKALFPDPEPCTGDDCPCTGDNCPSCTGDDCPSCTGDDCPNEEEVIKPVNGFEEADTTVSMDSNGTTSIGKFVDSDEDHGGGNSSSTTANDDSTLKIKSATSGVTSDIETSEPYITLQPDFSTWKESYYNYSITWYKGTKIYDNCYSNVCTVQVEDDGTFYYTLKKGKNVLKSDPFIITRKDGIYLKQTALSGETAEYDPVVEVYAKGITIGTLSGYQSGQNYNIKWVDESGSVSGVGQNGIYALKKIRAVACDTNGKCYSSKYYTPSTTVNNYSMYKIKLSSNDENKVMIEDGTYSPSGWSSSNPEYWLDIMDASPSVTATFSSSGYKSAIFVIYDSDKNEGVVSSKCIDVASSGGSGTVTWNIAQDSSIKNYGFTAYYFKSSNCQSSTFQYQNSETTTVYGSKSFIGRANITFGTPSVSKGSISLANSSDDNYYYVSNNKTTVTQPYTLRGYKWVYLKNYGIDANSNKYVTYDQCKKSSDTNFTMGFYDSDRNIYYQTRYAEVTGYTGEGCSGKKGVTYTSKIYEYNSSMASGSGELTKFVKNKLASSKISWKNTTYTTCEAAGLGVNNDANDIYQRATCFALSQVGFKVGNNRTGAEYTNFTVSDSAHGYAQNSGWCLKFVDWAYYMAGMKKEDAQSIQTYTGPSKSYSTNTSDLKSGTIIATVKEDEHVAIAWKDLNGKWHTIDGNVSGTGENNYFNSQVKSYDWTNFSQLPAKTGYSIRYLNP